MAFNVGKAFDKVKWADADEQPLRVAELALWSAMSDGEIDREELRGIANTMREIPGLEGFTRDEAVAMVDEMVATFTTEEAITERIAELAEGITDPDLRRVAYQLAVWCAGSDGELTEDENDFLQGLQEEFEISDREAERLFRDVIG